MVRKLLVYSARNTMHIGDIICEDSAASDFADRAHDWKNSTFCAELCIKYRYNYRKMSNGSYPMMNCNLSPQESALSLVRVFDKVSRFSALSVTQSFQKQRLSVQSV